MNNSIISAQALAAALITFGSLADESCAALSAVGDIAFTSWTSDSGNPGGENFSFIALADIGVNQSIFFDDEEWDSSTGFGGSTSEGVIQWQNTEGSIISAGTIITLSSASSNDSTNPSSNFGTITEPDTGFNLASIDGMFAYLGSVRNPTTFLAGIGDADSSSGLTSLTGTGLSLGLTALDTDGAVSIEYSGPRSGLVEFPDYLSLINDASNWSTNSALTNLPVGGFNTNSFTVIPEPSSALLLGLGTIGLAYRRRR
ncbi:PEP-CTERM sorting domain-containing protein [Roseibacillus persicicus]|uniref:PEP-CTERM sorting domain-containing protein n=1 Tax=Roseibacillus persicicus TaxID=454148 RepID=UPI00398AC3D1